MESSHTRESKGQPIAADDHMTAMNRHTRITDKHKAQITKSIHKRSSSVGKNQHIITF